jgi:hypothetical protein
MFRLSQLWSFLSFLWSETGLILDPDDGQQSITGSAGDNGSGLDPNGRL